MSKSLIYFIPGIKGSVLYNKHTSLTIWPPEKILQSWGIFFKNKSLFDKYVLMLKVPSGLKETEDDPNITVGNVIKTVQITPISGLINKKVYGPIINIINQIKSENDVFVEFSYDWRRSLEYCARKLYNHIETERKNNYNRIILICHSYGGLVSRYMIESDIIKSDIKIDYILNIGTPHYGSIKSANYLLGMASMDICSDSALKELCNTFDSLYDTISINIDDRFIMDKKKLLKSKERKSKMDIFKKSKNCNIIINLNIVNIMRLYNNNVCYGDGVVDVGCKKINTNDINNIIEDLKKDNEHIEILRKKFTKTIIQYILKTKDVDFNINELLELNNNN